MIVAAGADYAVSLGQWLHKNNMRLIGILIIATLFLACSNPKKDFENYCNKIETLEIPMAKSCDIHMEDSTFGIDSEIISKYYEFLSICGLLKREKEYTAIIYNYPADIILPIIITYTKSGKEIDRLSLYERYCGSGENLDGSSWFEITSEYEIVLKDSVNFYKRDESGEIIDSTRTSEKNLKRYYIDGRGKFKIIDQANIGYSISEITRPALTHSGSKNISNN